MAAQTVGQLIGLHPTNYVLDRENKTPSNKAWTKEYPPISNFNVWTRDVSGTVTADFDTAFLPLHDDDDMRGAETAVQPNGRGWRFNSEEDGVNWFPHRCFQCCFGRFQEIPTALADLPR